MKIEKKYLDLLIKVTQNSKCDLKNSRVRDRFLKNVFDEYQVKEEERVKICEKFCVKGKDKKPLMKSETNEKGQPVENFQFSTENVPKFQKEFEILLSEKCTIPLTSSDAKILLKIIDTTKYEPEIGEADIIDEHIIPAIK